MVWPMVVVGKLSVTLMHYFQVLRLSMTHKQYEYVFDFVLFLHVAI
jgi:hypothetical protein